MAYANTGLSLLVSGIGGSPKVFVYQSTDVHTDVDAADYFADGVSFGMEVNDLVFVIKTTATVGATLHTVLSVSAGAATISPAILA